MGKTPDVFGLALLRMWQWTCKQEKTFVSVDSPSPSEPCESRKLNDLPGQTKRSSPLSMMARKEPITGIIWTEVWLRDLPLAKFCELGYIFQPLQSSCRAIVRVNWTLKERTPYPAWYRVAE